MSKMLCSTMGKEGLVIMPDIIIIVTKILEVLTVIAIAEVMLFTIRLDMLPKIQFIHYVSLIHLLVVKLEFNYCCFITREPS